MVGCDSFSIPPAKLHNNTLLQFLMHPFTSAIVMGYLHARPLCLICAEIDILTFSECPYIILVVHQLVERCVLLYNYDCENS